YALFNRASDYAPNGTFIYDALHIGTSAHNYQGVFSYPDFVAEFESVLDPARKPANVGPGQGFGDGAFVDRDAGNEFDFTNVHFVPFIPNTTGSSPMTQSILTIVNYPPNGIPLANETAGVLVRYYDSSGAFQRQENFYLAENASRDLVNPLAQGGSAVIFSSEQVGAIASYNSDYSCCYYGAAYPSESYPARTLYAPFLTKGVPYNFSGWYQTTEMILFNFSGQNASVEVAYYNGTPNASPGEARNTYTIPAYGSLRVASTNLPSSWSAGSGVLASAVIHSNTPLSGMVRNLIGDADAQGVVYRIRAESNYRIFTTRGKNKMFTPLLKTGGTDNYSSSVIVQNTGETPVSFYFLFTPAGTSNGVYSPGVFTLPPKTMKVYSVSDYVSPGFSGTATLNLTTDPSVGTVALIAQVISSQGAEANEGIPDGIHWYQKRKDAVIIPFLPNQYQAGSTDWHSEFDVVNKDAAQDDYVHIDYHNPDGGVSKTIPNRLVREDSCIHYEGNNDLPGPNPPAAFSGSAAVLGTNLKHLGATVQINRWGKRGVSYHDILMGYSAWW
ncbi:MAG: hypothetical protein NTY64_22350, partial [Deltaproteobacteria bacterium]|nr:hypothetical protein [Deltaproteobacteria bacterium]